MRTLAFFRDDDVGELTPELRSLVELLIEERVPCNYLVVPAHLTRATAEYLRKLRASHPGLIEINQHGFLHEQVIGGKHGWSEFGGRRSYDEQRAAIAEGKRIMEELLSGDFSPLVFTPPSNKYDDNTLRAMEDLGFTVLSAIVETMPHRLVHYRLGRALQRIWFMGGPVSYHGATAPRRNIRELSIAIDVDYDVNVFGQQKLKTAGDLLREFERARAQHEAVGIMLHHATYRSASKLDTLRELIHALRSDPTVELRTIESIVGRTVRNDSVAV